MSRRAAADELWRPRPRARLATIGFWALLAGFLAALFAAAAVHERAGWRGLATGEATVLMQAESLLLDRDLGYTRLDHDRFTSRWQGAPTDLDLVSGSDGKRIVFDRPAPHALLLAPFLAVAPRNGFAIFHALLLAGIAVLTARVLGRTLPEAPLMVVALAFGSVAYAHVFFATSTIFVLALCVAAVAWVIDRPPGAIRAWAGAGALLAVAAASDPLYAVLPLCLFVVAKQDRWGFLGGFASMLVLLTAVRLFSGGGLITGIDAVAFRFTPATGFPLVDFTADGWTRAIYELRAFHPASPPLHWGFDVGLWWANVRYLLAGRTLGLMPYFLPLLLLPIFAGRDRVRRSVMAAAVLFVLGSLVLQPFDLAGGGGVGTLANSAFLPIYGALWLVPARPRSGIWGVGSSLAVLLLAAPFLLPTWLAPGQEPIDSAGVSRHVSKAAMRYLPYETSQQWLARESFIEHRGLWVRPVIAALWGEEIKQQLMVDGDARAEMLIASAQELAAVRLDFGPDAPSKIEVEGGTLGDRLLAPGGGIGFRVSLDSTARHPLWWTSEPMWLYRLAFELPGAPEAPLAFQLTGEHWREDDSSVAP